MTYASLIEAIAGAERFLKRAKELGAVPNTPEDAGERYWTPDGALSSAVKRSSMDLTRALARLRRSG